MGNNSSKYDGVAVLKAMTTKQLEVTRDFWIEALKKHDSEAGRNELAIIRMLLAERIGKPKPP